MAKFFVKAFSDAATVDLVRLGEQKKGFDNVQKFLTRFGYLQIGSFNRVKVSFEFAKTVMLLSV
jgi:hypothetical protein